MAKNKTNTAPAADNDGEKKPQKKTECPVSRQQFRDKAKGLDVTINGVPHRVPTKEFSTGSLGWYLNGKTTVQIDGKDVQVQIGLNLTLIGSKELPKE